MQQAGTPTYRVWGADQTAREPIELPALVRAVQNRQVLATTWLYLVHEQAWQRAADLVELKMLFGRTTAGTAATPPSSTPAVPTGVLRRIKLLAALDEEKLELFVRYMEQVHARAGERVVAKGAHGAAMYLVLQGQLRVISVIDGRETMLATLEAGEAFGEISVLDQGPRSADVVANADAHLLKISAAAFEQLLRDAPAAAAPFLLSLSKSIAVRFRQITKRYEDTLQLARAGQQVG